MTTQTSQILEFFKTHPGVEISIAMLCDTFPQIPYSSVGSVVSALRHTNPIHSTSRGWYVYDESIPPAAPSKSARKKTVRKKRSLEITNQRPPVVFPERSVAVAVSAMPKPVILGCTKLGHVLLEIDGQIYLARRMEEK